MSMSISRHHIDFTDWQSLYYVAQLPTWQCAPLTIVIIVVISYQQFISGEVLLKVSGQGHGYLSPTVLFNLYLMEDIDKVLAGPW